MAKDTPSSIGSPIYLVIWVAIAAVFVAIFNLWPTVGNWLYRLTGVVFFAALAVVLIRYFRNRQ